MTCAVKGLEQDVLVRQASGEFELRVVDHSMWVFERDEVVDNVVRKGRSPQNRA
jgi:hypothetical protein